MYTYLLLLLTIEIQTILSDKHKLMHFKVLQVNNCGFKNTMQMHLANKSRVILYQTITLPLMFKDSIELPLESYTVITLNYALILDVLAAFGG